MRKLMYGALALGTAMAVSFGAGAVDVDAATSVKLEQSEGDNMVLTGSSAKQFSVGLAKAKKDDLAVASWDLYDAKDNKATVDLSKYAKTKDVLLKAKADVESDEDAITILIKASDAIKVKYDKKKGTFEVIKGKADKYDGVLTYRTETSATKYVKVTAGVIDSTAKAGTATNDAGTDVNGSDTFAADLNKYQMSGATLYFATLTQKGKVDNATAGQESGNWTGAAFVYPQRGSKEAKVTVGKLANAPKVKANYVSGNIVVPKGVIYRKIDVSKAVPSFEPAKPLDKPVTITVGTQTTGAPDADNEINATAADSNPVNFAIDVQTPADTSKGKLASKVGRYVYSPMTTIKGLEDSATSNEVANTITATVKSKIETDQKKGDMIIEVTGEKDNDYMVYYTKSGKEAKTKVTSKGAKVVGVDPYTEMTIQRVGDNKKGEWASNTVKYVTKKLMNPQLKVTMDSNVTDIAIALDDTTSKAKKDAGLSATSKASGGADQYASPGEKITLTLKDLSSNGKEYDKITVKGEDKKEVSAQFNDSDRKLIFTMPNSAVTITTTTKDKESNS